MSINREELNRYYSELNLLVDEYVEKWKIRPKNLKKYLKPGSKNFNRFLERSRLNELSIARQVLVDILEDRYASELDGIITFENFKIYESKEYKIDSKRACLYKGIEKPTISYEKVLADYFDTDLSSIDIVDSEKHLFKIEDWTGRDYSVLVYSSSDLDIIKSNLKEHSIDEIIERKEVMLGGIEVDLSEVIDKSKLESKIEGFLSEEVVIKFVTDVCDGYKFKGKEDYNEVEFFIWIKNM